MGLRQKQVRGTLRQIGTRIVPAGEPSCCRKPTQTFAVDTRRNMVVETRQDQALYPYATSDVGRVSLVASKARIRGCLAESLNY